MKKQFFSVGEYCGTAFQIQRHSGDATAYLFNWLVTPGRAFEAIGLDDAAWLQPANWELAGEPGNEGIRVRDKASGLLYQHEFPTGADGRVDADAVDGHLATAREKFIYLKHKTRAALTASRAGILVRSDHALRTFADALASADRLRQAFLPLNPDLKLVIVSSQLDGEYGNPECLMLKVAPDPDWGGDDASWSRALALAERHF